MTLKNFYTANTAEPGDVFACVVTCHITPMGYRLYRCQYPNPDTADNIPQGMNYPNMSIIDLFPVVKNSGIEESR